MPQADRRRRPFLQGPRLSTIWRGGSRRQALYLFAWTLIVIGLVLVATEHWRRGLFVIAATVVLVGLLRATLSSRMTGWLVVRGRTSDVVFCLLFGITLAVAALLAVG